MCLYRSSTKKCVLTQGSDLGFLHVVITDRKACNRPLSEQVKHLASKVDAVILREPDLSDMAYEALAREVFASCQEEDIQFVVHKRVAIALNLRCNAVHLPLPQLKRQGRPAGIACIGTNVHEEEEVFVAEDLGADYLIASPIFTPSCKPGVQARGIAFLADVVSRARVPVFALGGINDENERSLEVGKLAGACRMSDYMRS